MQGITNFIQTDAFLIILACINLVLLIGFIANMVGLSKIKKENKAFMTKLGKGTDIKEDIANYIKRVEKVEQKNDVIINYCKNLDDTVAGCLQKIGMVRYSAFRDTGSDLSFALAMLDENNNGVILNGIYSREMSNIYAKPVEEGKSSYTLSQEEKEALEKAMKHNKI